MIHIEKPDDSTINITVKSENGICPFCNGSGWQVVMQRDLGLAELPNSKVKISIKCEWCKGKGKLA